MNGLRNDRQVGQTQSIEPLVQVGPLAESGNTSEVPFAPGESSPSGQRSSGSLFGRFRAYAVGAMMFGAAFTAMPAGAEIVNGNQTPTVTTATEQATIAVRPHRSDDESTSVADTPDIEPAPTDAYMDSAFLQAIWMGTSPSGDRIEGMVYEGLSAVSAEGAENLLALAHELDGNPDATAATLPSTEMRQLMLGILDDTYYGEFFSQEGRVKTIELFGLPGLEAANGPQPEGLRPVAQAEGNLDIPHVSASQDTGVLIELLGGNFLRDVRSRPQVFNAPGLTAEDADRQLLGLLQTYARRLNSYGNIPTLARARDSLMDAYLQVAKGAPLGKQDFNGMGFGAAQSIVIGIDPNDAPVDFPDARIDLPYTSFSMGGGMAEPMSHVDKFRSALGLSTGAVDHENRSVVSYLVGDPKGNRKYGVLNEKTPFSTSGVNWGKLLRPPANASAELRRTFQAIKSLPSDKSLEFPIDAVNAFGIVLENYPSRGDHLDVLGPDGASLEVRPVINTVDGEDQSWTLQFFDRSGNEVAINDDEGKPQIKGVIRTSTGRIKGDGNATDTAPMSSWGFCDLNTEQRLVKYQFEIPELTYGTVYVRAGDETLEIPQADAQKLVNSYMHDLAKTWIFAGFRFHDNPQTIRLENGRTISGRINSFTLRPTSSVEWGDEDNITIRNPDADQFKPKLRMTVDGSEVEVDPKLVHSIVRSETGEVTVFKTTVTKSDALWMKDLDKEWHLASADELTAVQEELLAAGYELGPTGADGVWGTFVANAILKAQAETPAQTRNRYEGNLRTRISFPDADPETGVSTVEGDALTPQLEVSIKQANGRNTWAALGQIASISGETPHDLRVESMIEAVQRLKGVFGSDSWMNKGVNNGANRVNKIEVMEAIGANRPDWAKGELLGSFGKLERRSGDRLLFVRGMYGDSSLTAEFKAWIQVGSRGEVLNSGFKSGEGDYVFGIGGRPSWGGGSQFNPNLNGDMVRALLVNGIEDLDDATASKLNLGSNWRSLLVERPPEPVEAETDDAADSADDPTAVATPDASYGSPYGSYPRGFEDRR